MSWRIARNLIVKKITRLLYILKCTCPTICIGNTEWLQQDFDVQIIDCQSNDTDLWIMTEINVYVNTVKVTTWKLLKMNCICLCCLCVGFLFGKRLFVICVLLKAWNVCCSCWFIALFGGVFFILFKEELNKILLVVYWTYEWYMRKQKHESNKKQ